MTTYPFSGHIIDQTTHRGLPDLRVEAWDAEAQSPDLIAYAVTDPRGAFTITLDDTTLAEHFQDRAPTIAFRVFRLHDGTYARCRSRDLRWRPTAAPASGRIVIDTTPIPLDDPMPEAERVPAESIVRGTLLTAAGAPVMGAVIKAFDQRIAPTPADVQLGADTTTDAGGQYAITYDAASVGTSGRIRPDLVVRAYDGGSLDMLVESTRLCQAPPAAVVHLVTGGALRGPSEIEALAARVAPHSGGEGFFETAAGAQIEHIACASGAGLAHVSAYAAAHALAAATGAPVEAHYALCREGLPADRRGLLLTPQRDLRAALQRAVAANTVPPSIGDNLDDIMVRLRTAAVDLAFERLPGATGSVGELIAGVIGTKDGRSLVDAYLASEQPIKDFWDERAQVLSAEQIASVKLALQLGALARFHAPLIGAIQDQAPASLRDLAEKSVSDWIAVLDGLPDTMAVPEGTPGADLREQKANYALVLRRSMEQAFPTAAIAADVARARAPESADLERFFADNQGFEFGKARVEQHLAENPGALAGVADAEGTRARLKQMERLFKLTTRHAEMSVLLDAGLHSARDVVRMGRAGFLSAHASALGGEAIAGEIFDNARRTASQALAFHARYGARLNRAGAYALPDLVTPSGAAGDIPEAADWTSLFGSPDVCDCEECSSIHGPAAYLVDLLQFLGTPGDSVVEGSPAQTAKDVLLARRPDLAHLDLSCDNTQTALPYIDLVNEILEHAVASRVTSPGPVFPAHIATAGTSEALCALPEIVPGEEDARAAAYGALREEIYPWSSPFDLDAAVARAYLAHLGAPRADLMIALAGAPDPIEIASERLGLSRNERLVITGGAFTNPPPSVQALWGLAESANLAALTAVPSFLQQSGMSFDELRDLLDTAFMDRLGAPTLTPAGACDTGAMTIAWTSAAQRDAALAAVHRFVRLQRRTGCSIREVDQALNARGGVLDDTSLVTLAAIDRLRARFNLPAAVVASWFGPLDTRAREGGKVPSYYDLVFQNKAAAVDPGLALDVVAANPADTLAAHAGAILAALRLDAADYALLTDPNAAFAALGEAQAQLAGPNGQSLPLTVENLSALHRMVTFARALGLSVRDFLMLHKLTGEALTPASSALKVFDPAAAEDFVQVVDEVRRSGLLPADLFYLFAGVRAPDTAVAPAGAATTAALGAMFSAMPQPEEGGVDRFVQQSLSAALRLDARTTGLLLTSILRPESGTGTLLDTFKTGSAPAPEHIDAYARLDRTATILRKLGATAAEVDALFNPAAIATVVLDLDALTKPHSDATTAALFRASLTLADVMALRPSLQGRSDGLLSLFTTLLALTPQSDLAAAGQAIASVTRWSAADVTALLYGPLYPHLTGLAGDASAAAALLLRLRDACAALKRAGVPADKALAWIDLTASPAAAAVAAGEIVQAARAKHDDAAWAAIGPTIRDEIREKQRDALVDYLVRRTPYTGADALFGALYIDVQTAPVQLTSRIKEAISAVQSFVQRALLDLEPGVKLSEAAARRWKWQKSYRVWEANRKIFLYPENWIYPELRDDKSPIFEELERDLRKKDITSGVAEDAIARYLERLDEIAKLDVVAVFHETAPGDEDHEAVDVLHVIGRTRLAPHKHFYRTRVGGASWTAWRSIDLDIDADHLVLMVLNRRVHLFWPVIEKKPNATQRFDNTSAGGAPAANHLEIRLAWSEYHDRKWSAPRTSSGDAVTLSPPLDPKRITFVPSGTSVACLLNPGLWLPGHTGLFLLGSFVPAPCSGQFEGLDRGLTFPDTNADMERAAYYFDKAAQEDATNPELALADRSKAIAYQIKADKTDPALLDKALDDAQSSEFTLTLPGHAVRVYQDDKQIPGSDTTLALPIRLSGSTTMLDVLGHTGSRFRVLTPHAVELGKDTRSELARLFFKDADHTFFAEMIAPSPTRWTDAATAHPGLALGGLRASDLRLGSLGAWAAAPPPESLFGHHEIDKGYRFWSFYHPYACDFLRALHGGGVPALLSWSDPARSLQFQPKDVFSSYEPSAACVLAPYPREEVDFSLGGAYASYNWEVFFHAPLLVATRLMENQRFEEAQAWFHYIFDPTTGGAGKVPQRFWKVRPFYENHDLATIQDQLLAAAHDDPVVISASAGDLKGLLGLEGTLARADLDAQVAAWQKDPFNPHAIARLRPLAYQKAVVMKYVENLIAWGDNLFRRETLESINEATQLYILAGQVLGKRPERIRPTTPRAPVTYAQIAQQDMGPLSDPIVEAEGLVVQPITPQIAIIGKATTQPPVPDLDTLTFCVPPDEMLLGLWDTVADRLFKIRRSMNIDGVARQLPLFEPPIDPALLVRAAAAGVDLASALDDVAPALPRYRFSVMVAKAMELAASVSALGGAYLSALEKGDAEHLARLRSGHEIDLLSAVREVKVQQIREAEQAVAGLQKSLDVVTLRRNYYAGLPRVSAGEMVALYTAEAAMTLNLIAQGIAAGASGGYQAPDLTGGAVGIAPMVTATYGGQNIGSGTESASRALSMYGGMLHDMAGIMTTTAGYDRRWEEWKLQERLANKEIEQIQKQLAAAQIRVALAEKDLDNHDLQIDHAREVEDHLRRKFTNEELYDWMSAELSTVYFQSYQLAYDVAKRAERALQYERAVTSSYIRFGYWDSLKNGLLAGERLQHDLRRMEVAYLDLNAREFEIVKHVSLAALDPEQLMILRETGACTFTLDQQLFDLDYPGHSLRRIKSVGVTIPAVNGPYASVNCTLSLNMAGCPVTQTIVTSSAQNDSGMFEPNLRDERYLPFEGADVAGSWTLSLPRLTNGFDVSAVSDVILHLRYTARDGGSGGASSGSAPRPGKRLFSLRAEFPDAWEQFMNPGDGAPDQRLEVDLDPSSFPFLVGEPGVAVSAYTLFAQWGHAVASLETSPLAISVQQPGASTPASLDLDELVLPSAQHASLSKRRVDSPQVAAGIGHWTLSVDRASLSTLPAGLFTPGTGGGLDQLDETLRDLWLLVEYTQVPPDLG